MTFSEKKVVDLIRAEFVPVWESVAPVTISTYKLDEEREVKGIVNGEIALYFCRPDGVAFDILPALQSPAQTLLAMKHALTMYRETDGAKNWDAVVENHRTASGPHGYRAPVGIEAGVTGLQKRAERIGDATDSGTKDLRIAIASKSFIATPAESFIIVEPGGLGLYKSRVRHEFTRAVEMPQAANAAKPPTLIYRQFAPEQWKPIIFEEVLEMPLEGHSAIYDTSSLAPFTIIEE